MEKDHSSGHSKGVNYVHQRSVTLRLTNLSPEAHRSWATPILFIPEIKQARSEQKAIIYHAFNTNLKKSGTI
jgi:ABC-type transporter MlaC component